MPNDAAPLPALPEGRERRSISPAEVLERAKQATQGIKIGRPRLYQPRLCDEAVKLGHAGKSWAAIARHFGISRKTLNEWERVYPEFSVALLRARAAAQAWWEDDIQESRQDKHYQAQAVGRLMGAQFEDYREDRSGASALQGVVDLLSAVDELANARAAAKIAAPGDGAKVVNGVASSFDPPAGNENKGK